MARQDKDGFADPAVVAAWRRMLWLVRGSADVVEALVPVAAGMTKQEVSRLLARAGAPSGKEVEPVEQVLGLLGVVPRARYEALLTDHQTLLKEYDELGSRVGEAEQNIDRLRGMLGEQGLADEEQLLDSWGGLVRRTLRAQAGLMRSIASAAGSVTPPAVPTGARPDSEPGPAEAPPPEPSAAPAPEPEPEPVEARAPEPAPPPAAAPNPAARRATAGATRKRTAPGGGASSTSASKRGKGQPERAPAASDPAPPRAAGTRGVAQRRTRRDSAPEPARPEPAPPSSAAASGVAEKRTSSRGRASTRPSSTSASKKARPTG